MRSLYRSAGVVTGVIRILFLGACCFLASNTFGQAVEICNNNIDDDGDGLKDCLDPDCNFAVTIEKGCRCFDGVDNDGDAKIDAADTNCASYYGLSFVGSGSGNCSLTPPAGNPFSTIAAPQTSSQNTADTPAHISVGDMNNDGMPDVVITSKWNSTVQVVATTTIGSFDAGDIMGDFRTPGSNIFPLAGSKYVFEHETLIADIDKDKIGELYVIASERGGSPNNKPVKFFLCGFKYAPNSLIPLFNAVYLGPDRPGSMGIADFDGDGTVEVYLRNRIYAAESGVLVASSFGVWDTKVNAGPVAVNIIGDNKLELVCGPIIYTVPSLGGVGTRPANLALTVANTMPVAYFPKGYNDTNEYGVDQASSTSTADFNGDGFLDVLMTGAINCSGNEVAPCGNPITTIFYWDVKNNTVKTYAPPDTATPATGWAWGTGRINLGDATGDGKLDALFITGNKLHCLTLDAGGNLVVVWTRTINDSLSGICALTVYDFDNNGHPEVVYRDAAELAVVDGLTGATKLWSAGCGSHTFTEGPVVADVNGDGNTDICVPCYTNGAIGSATVQQQSLGQTRLYYSSTNAWLPTRSVWNQHPYYVTNINDDLTVPFPQIDPSLVFSNAPCPNGLPGPQRPLNLFMNQVPNLSVNGCPVFPAPDLAFKGDDPANPGVDSDGDGVYTPTVTIIPPICGDLNVKAFFTIINSGDLPIVNADIPVSFFNGNPTLSPVTATRLLYPTIHIANLGLGETMVTTQYTIPGPGTVFDLYIVLYNNGSVLPINLAAPSGTECSLSNNMYKVTVAPDPFTLTVSEVGPNIKCGPNVPPFTGEIRARIFKGATEQTDYSPYSFQWYTGVGTGSPIAGGTTYHLTNVQDGTYTCVVTNIAKGCKSLPINGVVTLGQINPTITLTVTSNQTTCTPPNGRIDAAIAGGNTGYTFDWYDIALTPLGITGPAATNLLAGNYVVVVTKNGCSTTSAPATVNGPVIPDAQATLLAGVIDCLNPNSGSVTATALIGGVAQPTAGYTFTWFFNPGGSVLPPANGTGPTRTGLAVGDYRVEIKDNATQCLANQKPVITVTNQTVVPTVAITEVAPQTSCNPAAPNGVLTAVATGAGLVSPTNYTFQWFKGDNTLPANLHASVTGAKGETATQVAGGGVFYTVKVTTANNCSATNKLIITETLNKPIVTLTPAANGICNPALAASNYSGSVTATATFGGVPVASFTNYQFVWHNGPLVTDPTIVVANDKLPVLSQLNGGDYTVTLERLDLGCKSVPVTATVVNATVLPVLTTAQVGSTNCTPALANGTASLATVDGVAPPGVGYTYAWTGPVAPAFPVNVATNHSNTAALIKLQGGIGYDYTVLVTNGATGCQKTAAVNVADAKVLPIITLGVLDNGICNPALTVPPKTFSGKITATVTNQVGALTDYSFVFGAGMGAGVQAANVFDQLNGGATAYSAVATHTVTGCVSAQVTAPVANVQAFPVLTTSTTPSTNCAVGKENGVTEILTVDATAVGVATGYTYAWTGPVAPAFPVTPATNNSNTARLIKLQGGIGFDYTGVVTNQGNGCQTSVPLNVVDAKVLPIITLAPADNGICNPALTVPPKTFSGKITATVTNQVGALTDYSFAFGAGMGPGVQAANVFDQLNGGATAYSAVATHTVTGCVSAQVTTPVGNLQVLPLLTTSTTPSTNCTPGKENGVAEVLTVDGTAVGAAIGYTYAWTGPVAPAFPVTPATNNSNAAKLIKLQGGIGYDYTGLITNQGNGCQTSVPLNVVDAKVLPIITLAPVDNGICNPGLTVPAKTFSGKITATVTNQVGALTDYTFAFGAGMGPGVQAANIFDQLNGGATPYSAVATHTVTGCVSAQVTTPVGNVQVLPLLTTSTTPSTNCTPGKEDGVTEVLTVDGTAVGLATGYTYAWTGPVAPAFPVTPATNNSNTAKLIKLQGGIGFDYSGVVTNQANGCQTTVPLNVVDAKVLPLLTLTPQPNTICDPAKAIGGVFDGQVGAVVDNMPGGGVVTDYFFNWSVGTDGNGVVNLPGVDVGTYSVTALHNPTGCTSAVYSAQVTSAKTLPTILMDQLPSTNCPGGTPNGTAQVTDVLPNGKTYDYRWFDGNTTGGAAGPVTSASLLTTNDYTGVQGGMVGPTPIEYTVEVTIKQTGCVNTNTTAVDDDSQVPIIVAATGTDNTFCVGANGTAVLNSLTYRGVPQASPYVGFTFLWSNLDTTPNTTTGLAAGTYTLTAESTTDNCLSNPVSVTIADVLYHPVINFVETPQGSCDPLNPNGTLVATVNENVPGGPGGGPAVVAGYSFAFTSRGNPYGPVGPAPNPMGVNGINQLEGNIFYEVTVTRTLGGCHNVASHLLSESINFPLIALGGLVPQAACTVPDGSVTGTVTFPVALPPTTYSYYWLREDPGQTTNDKNVVKATVQANLGAGFFNKINTVAAATNILASTVYGRYTLVVEDDFNKCLSEPVSADIANNTASNITINIGTLPTSCTANGSLIIRAVRTSAPVASDFDFAVFRGGPTNPTVPIDYYTNPPNPPSFAGGVLETLNNVNNNTDATTTVPGIVSDLYTVVATDNLGCKNHETFFLPFQDAHSISAIPTDVTNCTVDNGSLAINTTFPPVGPAAAYTQKSYRITFYAGGIGSPATELDVAIPSVTYTGVINAAGAIGAVGNPYTPVGGTEVCNVAGDQDGDGKGDGVDEDCVGRTTANLLPPGFYVAESMELVSGSNCKVFEQFEIKQNARPPIVDLAAALQANTACNVLSADGSAVISITKDAQDLVAGVTYSLDVAPAPLVGVYPVGPLGVGNQTINGLKPDSAVPLYTATVTSNNNCTTVQTFSIPDQPIVAQLVNGSIAGTDAQYCVANLEQTAKVVVSNVKLPGGANEDIRDYQFQWFTDAALTTNVFTALGNPVAIAGGDEFINQTPAAANGTVPSGTVWVGDYFVRAVKMTDTFSASGGVGCTTAPFTVNIGDDSVNPNIVLTPNGNTSCDPLFFEGSITVGVTTLAGTPGAGATYDYNWAPNGAPLSGSPTNSVGNTGIANNQPNIGDGTYTLTAINNATGCDTSLPTTLVHDTPPVFTLTATVANLQFCNTFDGSIVVNAVLADLAPAPIADFDFVWFKTDPNTVSILDGTNALIPVDDRITNVTFPTITVGTYYVKTVRKAGTGAGAGCESSPQRKDILDDRIFPTATAITIASTACDNNFDGRITIDATTASGPGNPSTYDFVWTVKPGAPVVILNAPNAASPHPTGVGEVIGPGLYTVQVSNFTTGCPAPPLDVTLLKNTIPLSITSVTSTPVDRCLPLLPNGTGTVNTISVDGGAGVTTDFTYTWANNPGMAPVLPVNTVSVNGLDIGTFYVKAVRNAFPVVGGSRSASGCETAIVPFVVDDARVVPTVAVATIASTACDNNFDGRIIITATTTGSVAPTYDFNWTSDPGAPVVVNNPPAKASPHITGGADVIGPGNYTINVIDFASKCATSAPITLLKNTVPLSITAVTATPVDRCLPLLPNGTGTVNTISVDGGAGVTTDFTYTWANNPGMAPVLPVNTVSVNGLDIGTFYVKAVRNAFPVVGGSRSASGCETAIVPFVVDDARVVPTVAVATIASTACDNNFDGRIIITATTTGSVAPTYDFNWTSDPGAPVVVNNPPAKASPHITGGADVIGPGNYTINVIDFASKCATSAPITLLKNTVPLSITAVTATPVDRCLPLLPNGTGTVNTISVDGGAGVTTDFTYTWANNPGMAPVLPVNTVSVNGLDIGTFYVKAVRNTFPVVGGSRSASGCETAIVPFIVDDARVVPTVAITTISNTSCDNNFDGQITINASTAGNPGATYDFVWTSDPGAPVVVNNPPTKASPHITGGADVIGPGNYTINVIDFASKCATSAPVTLLSTPQVIDVVTVNKTDQMICFPDGSIAVTALTIGGPGNFTYEWYKDDPANPPLVDALTNPITVGTLVPGVAATQFPTMGFGTYFVRATKDASTPGAGCTTPPFRIDVLDLHQDPRIQFTYTPNSSCDPINPNGIVLADASEQGGANGDTYSFSWTLNAAPLPPATTETLTNNSSQLDNAFEGTYILAIMNASNTGCQFTSSLDVELDLNISLPNIVNTSQTDPLDCLSSGSASVTGISIGGGPVISGAALAAGFQFEWYDGTFPGGLNGVITPAYIGIGPGSYFVVAKDVTTQCKSGPTEVQIIDDNIVYPVVAITQPQQQISCIVGAGTGSLAGTADGQTDANPNYTFDWFNNLANTPPVFANTSTITNLANGDYSLFVRDVTTNCTATQIYIMPDDSPIYFPVISIGGNPRTFCVGLDGSFLARVTNLEPGYPLLPYNYTSDLFIGATPNLLNPPNFPNMPLVPGFPANFLQPGLDFGTYTVRVTDNNTGCAAVLTGAIADARTNPVVTIVEENPLINCDPARPNGQLAASADGGQVGGYNFDWVAGTTVPTPISGLLVSDNILIGRTAGNYSVRVTNSISGCFADKTGEITDGTLLPPVPSPTVVFDRQSCITPDGWVTVTVGGETNGYTFDWYNGTTVNGSPYTGVDYIDIDIGPYAVTATDVVTGCVSLPGIVEVLDKRTLPQFILASTPSVCSDTGKGGNGSLTFTATIVDLPIDKVVWIELATNGNAGEGAQVFGVYPGLYRATVTTMEGCVDTGDVLVGTEIGAFNGVSDNGGDGQNDAFVVDCISNFPNNNVKIFNRAGILVYEGLHYDNNEVAFRGTGDRGLYLQGSRLPEGTYFYVIDKGDGSKLVSGYLELTR